MFASIGRKIFNVDLNVKRLKRKEGLKGSQSGAICPFSINKHIWEIVII